MPVDVYKRQVLEHIVWNLREPLGQNNRFQCRVKGKQAFAQFLRKPQKLHFRQAVAAGKGLVTQPDHRLGDDCLRDACSVEYLGTHDLQIGRQIAVNTAGILEGHIVQPADRIRQIGKLQGIAARERRLANGLQDIRQGDSSDTTVCLLYTSHSGC